MSEDRPNNWRERVKSPSEINKNMIGGKNSLPTDKNNKVDYKKIREEKESKGVKHQEQNKESAKKDQAKNNTPKSEKTIEKKVEKTDSEKTPQQQKNSSTKTKSATKAISNSSKLLSFARGAVSFTAKAITAYEVTKEAIEYLNEQEGIKDDLQKIHELYPDKFPEPPDLSKETEKVSAFTSEEEKENMTMALEEFEDKQIDFDLEFEKGLEQKTNEELVEEYDSLGFSGEEKENMVQAMDEFTEEEPAFLAEIGQEEIEEPDMSFYMDEPDLDSGSTGDDGNSDSGGGGDGGDD